MSDARHTPLPWIRDENYGGKPALWPDDIEFFDSPIARFPYSEDAGRTKEEAEANARLVHHRVHAYDDLLAACEALLATHVLKIHSFGNVPICATCRAVDKARAAVAKAKGATP